MMFDFTNYTFSGLLSILASIYGIGSLLSGEILP